MNASSFDERRRIPQSGTTGGAPDPAASRVGGYILVVDDEPEIRRLIREILEDEHYRVVTAENAAAARAAYARERPDLVLLDIWMPDADGITLLKEWAAAGQRPETPVVMISGHGTVETAVEATRLGAYDFIEKPLSMGKLLATVERALEAARRRRAQAPRGGAPGSETPPDAAPYLAGKSQAMQGLRATLERFARADAPVLITGEAGSGRRAAARYLHAKSARATGPFVEIALAAAPAVEEDEEETARRLFGAEREGRVVPGALEAASGGTVVLVGVEELEPSVQALLLEALSKRAFTRLGGRERLPLAARLVAIAGPAAELGERLRTGRFREDLYYRLNVLPVAIPPLREHREDVPELANFLLNLHVDRERLPYRRLTTAALNRLRTYDWPGNVRSLENVIERLLLIARGEEIGEAEVTEALAPETATAGAASVSVGAALFALPLKRAREQFERAYLEYHLARAQGNVGEVARAAGLERTHLYRKLKQLGLSPKSSRDSEEPGQEPT
jgi:DNA-binding NtrC family response regulator